MPISGVLPDRKGLQPSPPIPAAISPHSNQSRWSRGTPAQPPSTRTRSELLDDQAEAACRRRLRDLDDEIAKATSWSDEARAARLQLERDALLEQLAAATGLLGRNRVAGSNAERARVAVRKAIVAALERIAHHDPSAACYVRDSIQTGRVCRFDPDPGRNMEWRLD